MVQSRSARLASRKSKASSKSNESSESKGDENDGCSDERKRQQTSKYKRKEGNDKEEEDHDESVTQSKERKEDDFFDVVKTGSFVAKPLETNEKSFSFPSSSEEKVTVARRTRRSKHQKSVLKVETKGIFSSQNATKLPSTGVKSSLSKPTTNSSSAVTAKMKSLKSYFAPKDGGIVSARSMSVHPSEEKDCVESDHSDDAVDDFKSANFQLEDESKPQSPEFLLGKFHMEQNASEGTEPKDIESSSKDISQTSPKSGTKRKTTTDYSSSGDESSTKRHKQKMLPSKDHDYSIFSDSSKLAGGEENGLCPLEYSSSNRIIEGATASENPGKKKSNRESATSPNNESTKMKSLEMELTTEMPNDATKQFKSLRGEKRNRSKADDQEASVEKIDSVDENPPLTTIFGPQHSSLWKDQSEDHNFNASDNIPNKSPATKLVKSETSLVVEMQIKGGIDVFSVVKSDQSEKKSHSEDNGRSVHKTKRTNTQTEKISELAEGVQQFADNTIESNRKDGIPMSPVTKNEVDDEFVQSKSASAVGEDQTKEEIIDPLQRRENSSSTFDDEDMPNRLKMKPHGVDDNMTNTESTDISYHSISACGCLTRIDDTVVRALEPQSCKDIQVNKDGQSEPEKDNISLTVNQGVRDNAGPVSDTSLPVSTELSPIQNSSSSTELNTRDRHRDDFAYSEYVHSTEKNNDPNSTKSSFCTDVDKSGHHGILTSVPVSNRLESLALEAGESEENNAKDVQSNTKPEMIDSFNSHLDSTRSVDSHNALDAGQSAKSQFSMAEESQRTIYSGSKLGEKMIDTLEPTNISTDQLQCARTQSKEMDDSQNPFASISCKGVSNTTVTENPTIGNLNKCNFEVKTRKNNPHSSTGFHLPSFNKQSQISEIPASNDQENTQNSRVCSTHYGVSVIHTSTNMKSGTTDQGNEKEWNTSHQSISRFEPEPNQQTGQCKNSLNVAKRQLNDRTVNGENILNSASSVTNNLGDGSIRRPDHNSNGIVHKSHPPEVMQSCEKRRTISVDQLKMALFLESSRTHYGLGAQRIFSDYLEALEKFITLGSQERPISERSNSAVSPCRGIEATLKKFLKTGKMKRLHNKLILAIMSESLRLKVPLKATISHLPTHWKKVTKIHFIPREQVDFDNKSIAQDESIGFGKEMNDLKDIARDRELRLREWKYNFGPTSGAWTTFGNELSISKSYVSGFDYKDAVRSNKRAYSMSNEVLPSARLPGALEIDPFARKIARQTALTVSENAIWLLIIALREHSKSLITEIISNCRDLDKGYVSGLPKSFMTSIAHNSDAPVGDSIQKSLDDIAASSAEKRKMTVIKAADLYEAIVANPVLAGGNRSSSRLASMQSLSSSCSQVPHDLDRVNCVVNAAIERTASNWQQYSSVNNPEDVVTAPLQPGMEVPKPKRSKASAKASLSQVESRQTLASSQHKQSKKSRGKTSTALVSSASISDHNEKNTVENEKKRIESDPSTLLNDLTPKLLQLEKRSSHYPKEENTNSSDSKPKENGAERSTPTGPVKPASAQRRGSKNLAVLMARSTSRPQSTSDDKKSTVVESSSPNEANDSFHVKHVSKTSGSEKGNDDNETKRTTPSPSPPARPRGRGFGVKNLAAMRARSSVSESGDSGK